MDAEEHDQNQEQKFGLNMLQRDDILSFDVSCFSDPKIAQSYFASSKNSFYKIDYVDNGPKDYPTNDSDYIVSNKAIVSKRLAVDTQNQQASILCSDVHNFMAPNVCWSFYSPDNFFEEFHVLKHDADYEDDYLISEDQPCNEGIGEESFYSH